jgi:hypothetical protein
MLGAALSIKPMYIPLVVIAVSSKSTVIFNAVSDIAS